MIICEMCDQSVHIHCLKPKLTAVPRESWFCHSCIKCTLCKKKLPPVLSAKNDAKWLGQERVCDKCAQTLDERNDQDGVGDEENTCAKCLTQYEGEFVECDKCE